MSRLKSTDGLADTVRVPAYNRDAAGEGIVHLGLGAFHKAHQAVYTDDALALAGGDWRIVGVSLRSAGPAAELCAQDGLYTLVEADTEGTEARVIGAISRALAHAHGDAAAVRDALVAPSTRIVTITVTEKGYGIDRSTGGVDLGHEAIAHDLARPDAPIGVAGLIVQSLAARRAAGTGPFTVLSCDNLPENGVLTRSLILDFAARTDPALGVWIAENVAFPSSMVDRITPAADDSTMALAAKLTGRDDRTPVMAERFRQWVIEDRFPSGRPAWDAAGALLVDDVAPYERMKLRMLNGAHSMLAYTGFLAGHRHVRDVMADAGLARLVQRHLAAAAATMEPLTGVDFEAYADDLVERFRNPHLAHETYQIAMDGSEKIPQRIFAPARDALHAGADLRAFAFATAAWIRYCTGRDRDDAPYDLRDPREAEIMAAIEGRRDDAAGLADALLSLPRLVPTDLLNSALFRDQVVAILRSMLERGVSATIVAEAGYQSKSRVFD